MTTQRITETELATIRDRHNAIEQPELDVPCHRTDGLCTGTSCWVCDPDDDVCPDCLPGSRCLACEDDERFHTERDTRLEGTNP